MASVVFDRVSKVFPDGTRAVDRLDLEITDGEFMVLVGPSGCGKTTALRMVAGLEEISEGLVSIGGSVVNDLSPKRRDIAMVFQSYALYPHLSVRDNVAFPLKIAKVPRGEIDRRVADAARILDLEPYLRRKPRALSGGQRQRVAMGRAIVREPSAFLMDEPLSNLDAKLRVQMRREIARLHRQLGATMVYVTHDQVEAMTLGDRIVVLDKGQVQQIAPPMTLYEKPRNTFVAGFIGSPAMNFVSGEIAQGGTQFRARGGTFSVELGRTAGGGQRVAGGQEVILGVRPENVRVAKPGDAASVRLRLDLVEPMGNEVFLHASAGEHEFTARVAPQPLPEPGADVALALDAERLHFFDPVSRVSLDADAAPP